MRRFDGLLARAALTLALLAPAAAAVAGDYVRPWRSPDRALVVDAYVYTDFDWLKLVTNRRLVGFIHKASDGRITSAACHRGPRTKREVCRAKWRRYVATRQVYRTRRLLAKQLGLKWGSYHLGRPGDPIEQALHYLRYAKPGPDELMALDIEDNDPEKWMSLAEAERFARFIRRKTGRLPLLYTNHSTAVSIARQRASYPTLARMNLWYARFKEDVRGAFPMGRWASFAIWQFQAKTNCRRSCAVRLAGTDKWMDVNVVNMTPDALRAAWPLDAPLNIRDEPDPAPKAGRVPRLVAAGKRSPLAERMRKRGILTVAATARPKIAPRDRLPEIVSTSDVHDIVFRRARRSD